MKKAKFLSLFIVMIMLVVAVVPASAQDLGDNDSSEFVVQNTSGAQVTVTIQFVNSTGAIIQPTCLDTSGPCTFPNPFTLAAAASKVVKVSSVPAAQLPPGKYSVIISSTGQVVAVASVYGAGTNQFSGGYGSFETGSTTVYLPGFYHNFGAIPWFSMITVQNIGTGPADVTVTINCENATNGTLTQLDIPQYGSRTWKLKSERPAGWTSGTVCRGSATITSDQPIVATDNNNIPSAGNTLTSLGFPAGSGSSTVYIPALYKNFGCTAAGCWQSGLVLRKIESGSTTATITFSDGPSITCNLDDTAAGKFCIRYIPSFHTADGRFGATITTNPAKQIIGLVNISYFNATTNSLSIAYNGLGTASGTGTVNLPLLYKNYFNWISGIMCQNIGTINTDVRISYEGYPGNAYNKGVNLTPGAVVDFFVPNEAFLPASWEGSAKITAVTAGAKIACVANLTNLLKDQPGYPGDWSVNYNGLNQ